MTSRDAARMGSLCALVALLEETETSAVPGVTRARAAFITEIKKADTLDKLRADDLKPVRQLRRAAFQKLETVVLRVGGRALSYAVETGDPQLILRCRLDLRALTGGAFAQRLSASELVHDRLVELLSSADDTEITAADMTELAEAIAEARAQLVEPRHQLGRRMNARAELKKQFSRLSEFVRLRLDPLFRPLRQTNPGLYLRYRIARKQLRRSPRDGEDNAAAQAGLPSATAAPAKTATSANPSGTQLPRAA